jgi:trk system potassium uptake protein TrkH
MMRKSQTALSYAVQPAVIIHYLGQILLILAVLALAPLLVSLLFREYQFSERYAVVIVLSLLLALPARYLRAREQIQANEALVIVALAFLLAPLLMLYPLSSAGISLIDTAFEAVSAVTTTGLSTLETVADKPRTFLFARAWAQWYGGLGIIVFSIALLMRNQLAARRLTATTGSDSLVTTAGVYARRMLWVYLALTIGGFCVLLVLTGSVFDSLLHALAAISTGGFSPFDNSLAAYPAWSARFAVLLIALLGAVPLPLYYLARHEGWRHLFLDVEVRTLLALVLVVTGLLTLSLHHASGMDWATSAGHGLLQSLSAQSTAGFSSLDIAALDDSSKIVLILSMFVGGGAGSTAGGIKLLRLLIALRLLQLLLLRSTLPAHAVAHLELEDRVVANEDIQNALLLILLFAAVIVLSWLVFVACGYPALDSLFEVVSATGTVGLSAGITSTALEPGLKLLLCANMLLGRIEIIALVVVLYHRTWFGRRNP